MTAIPQPKTSVTGTSGTYTLRVSSSGFYDSVSASTLDTVSKLCQIALDKPEELAAHLPAALRNGCTLDELRDTLVPVNNRWKVGEVLDAARRRGADRPAPDAPTSATAAAPPRAAAIRNWGR